MKKSSSSLSPSTERIVRNELRLNRRSKRETEVGRARDGTGQTHEIPAPVQMRLTATHTVPDRPAKELWRPADPASDARSTARNPAQAFLRANAPERKPC